MGLYLEGIIIGGVLVEASFYCYFLLFSFFFFLYLYFYFIHFFRGGGAYYRNFTACLEISIASEQITPADK